MSAEYDIVYMLIISSLYLWKQYLASRLTSTELRIILRCMLTKVPTSGTH
jgi:hypothetical protein